MEKFKNHLFPFVISTLPILAVFFPAKNIGFFVLFTFLLALFEKNKIKNFKKNKSFLLPYIAFLSFGVLMAFLSKDVTTSLKALERYISLLVIPVIIFSSNLDLKRINFILKSFVILMLLVSVFSIGKLIWFVEVFGDWIEVMRGVNKNDTYLQFKYPHLMWDVHPSYWSYLMIIVNVILLNNTYFQRPFSKKISIFLLIIFNLNLLYLAARVPLFINFCIHLISITILFRKKIKYILFSYTIIFLTLTIAYYKLPFLSYKIKAISGDDRFFLWDVAHKKVKSNYYILGEGLGLSKQFIEEEIKSIEDPRKDYKGNEIHNQYLSFLLETGIIGVLFLLYIYIRPNVYINHKYKISISWPSLSIVILILMASIIEPFFSVIKGIIIFALFSSLFKLVYINYEKNKLLNKVNSKK